MLIGIAASPAVLVGRTRAASGVSTFFEFWGPRGAPDLLFVEFDPAERSRRSSLGLPAVTDYSQASVLAALALRPRSAAELEPLVHLSRTHLQRAVLPALSEGGWAVEGVDRRWQSPEPLRPVARSIVAIEAKRRDWAKAIEQARRYRWYANRSVVVLDSATSTTNALARARDLGDIGLATVSVSTGRMRSLYLPPWRAPRRQCEFIVAGERALDMDRTDIVSGPILPVFGRILLARENDPRLSPALRVSGMR